MYTFSSACIYLDTNNYDYDQGLSFPLLTGHLTGYGNTDPLNPLTPGTFCKKMRFLDILVLFKLDLNQISFNPVENAFATQQLAFLATSITFYHIVRQFLEEKLTYIFRFFDFWNFFFAFLFSPFLRKHHQDGQILAWSSQVQWQEILL